MSKAVEQLVAEIESLDLDGLRAFWRERYGAPPPLRSEPIMRQLLAWRVQAKALGGLDDDTRKALARSGPVQPEGKHLGVGARLTRIGTKSLTSGYGVFLGDDCVATALSVNVFYDMTTRRSMVPPPEVRAIIEQELECPTL